MVDSVNGWIYFLISQPGWLSNPPFTSNHLICSSHFVSSCCSHSPFPPLFYSSLLLSVSCYQVFSSCSLALAIFHRNTFCSFSPLAPQFNVPRSHPVLLQREDRFNIHEQSFLFLYPSASLLLSLYSCCHIRWHPFLLLLLSFLSWMLLCCTLRS